MKQGSSILSIDKLTTGYKSKKRRQHISESLQLSIQRGELVALLGPNGCGKSTLLRTIAALQKPIAGSVFIDKQDILKLRSKEKARLLSLVLTENINSANLIVQDLVGVGRYPHTGAMGVLTPKDKQVIRESLEECGVAHYAECMYAELSDGEKQRVMIARALAQDTPLMMLDEPTAHLDLPNRVELMKMLRDLTKETQKAVLLSSHELDLALQWCDTIWLMNKFGEVTIGTPEDLVLNGTFSTIFGNKSFFFDMNTASFKMKRNPQKNIALEGDGVAYIWTKRALERKGYGVSSQKENCLISVTVKERGIWMLNDGKEQKQYTSIGALLELLQTKIKSY